MGPGFSRTLSPFLCLALAGWSGKCGEDWIVSVLSNVRGKSAFLLQSCAFGLPPLTADPTPRLRAPSCEGVQTPDTLVRSRQLGAHHERVSSRLDLNEMDKSSGLVNTRPILTLKSVCWEESLRDVGDSQFRGAGGGEGMV